MTDWAGGVTVYTYTAAGRLSGMRLPNGVQTAYDYDAAGRLVEIEHRNASGGLLARYTYTLDGVGNRVRVVETILQPEEEEPTGPGDVVITVRDTDGNLEVGLEVYTFDGPTYTGYNGTTNVSGQVTLTLPQRQERRAIPEWRGQSLHCARVHGGHDHHRLPGDEDTHRCAHVRQSRDTSRLKLWRHCFLCCSSRYRYGSVGQSL